VEVNGHRVDIPAYRVVPGEEVRLAAASRELTSVKVAQEAASRGQPVKWLAVDTEKATGRMTERPTREAIPINAQEQLIVELYSK
jgi:small subunit ribosomal protein S4